MRVPVTDSYHLSIRGGWVDFGPDFSELARGLGIPAIRLPSLAKDLGLAVTVHRAKATTTADTNTDAKYLGCVYA